MGQKPIVFFIRNKPQDADIIELVLNQKRFFVGYPPFKKGVPFNECNIISCTFDISKDSFTEDNILNSNFYREVSKNRKLVEDRHSEDDK